MQLNNLLLSLLSFSCVVHVIAEEQMPTRSNKDVIMKALKITYYTAEVLTPFIFIGAAAAQEKLEISKIGEKGLQESPIATNILGVAGSFAIINTFVHGCKSLHKELQPLRQSCRERINKSSWYKKIWTT